MITIVKLLLLALNFYMVWQSRKDWVAGASLALVIVVLLDGLVKDLVQ